MLNIALNNGFREKMSQVNVVGNDVSDLMALSIFDRQVAVKCSPRVEVFMGHTFSDALRHDPGRIFNPIVMTFYGRIGTHLESWPLNIG